MNNNKGENIDIVLRYLYYLTPLYMILDYFFSFNVRISFLTNFPVYKFIYYIFCGVFAFIIYKFPVYTYYIAFLENMINLAINIIGFIYPYLTYTDVFLEKGKDHVQFYDLQTIINFTVSGTVLIITLNILQIKITSERREII